jgi:hypothetical protein
MDILGNRFVAHCTRRSYMYVYKEIGRICLCVTENEALMLAGQRLSGKNYIDNSRDTINRWLRCFLIHKMVLWERRKTEYLWV